MSGESDEYNDVDVDELVRKMAAAFKKSGGARGKMRVTADIEWNNSWNRQSTRTVNLAGLNLTDTRAATGAAMAARAAAAAIKGPQSWRAQYNDLKKTAAGRLSLGVAPATMRRWDRGTQKPSRKSLDRIAQASRERWDEKRDRAEQRYLAAAREAADALTEAVMEATGGDVRFRDIDDLEF